MAWTEVPECSESSSWKTPFQPWCEIPVGSHPPTRHPVTAAARRAAQEPGWFFQHLQAELSETTNTVHISASGDCMLLLFYILQLFKKIFCGQKPVKINLNETLMFPRPARWILFSCLLRMLLLRNAEDQRYSHHLSEASRCGWLLYILYKSKHIKHYLHMNEIFLILPLLWTQIQNFEVMVTAVWIQSPFKLRNETNVKPALNLI